MVALIVVVTVCAFIVIDMLVRLSLKRAEDARARREREAALEVGLRLSFAQEAASLKRVEVAKPRARILAVDDEEVVLESLRKVLVLDGYSVDTVETGPEALLLVQKHDYDFVFTDLKMPEMDGVEVTKAVKHLRPDVDVIIITGYATVDSAVETMKSGATDYVQKPFTADELTDFVNKALIRRQDRIDRRHQPKAALITPSSTAPLAPYEFAVWAGLFFDRGHSWISIEPSGAARVGIDDFAQKLLGPAESITLPPAGAVVKRGDTLLSLARGTETVSVSSPLSGHIDAVNMALVHAPILLNKKPYDSGWVCRLIPSRLSEELHELKIGAEALDWYKAEAEVYANAGTLNESTAEGERMSWKEIGRLFLQEKDAAG